VLARVKRVLNDYTLASELDRQFGDLPVGLRKILLSMIDGFAAYCLHANDSVALIYLGRMTARCRPDP
jgi:hypothetical protein